MLIKTVTAAAVAAVSIVAFTAPAYAADRHVTIVNKTGHTIKSFYASRVSTNDWEEDILGKDTLDAGDSVDVDIDDGTGACRFDFKAEFDDGDSLVKQNINVCEISSYTYTE